MIDRDLDSYNLRQLGSPTWGKTKPRHGEYRGFYGWRLVFGGQSPSYLRYHTE
jgi:hypothetical protein